MREGGVINFHPTEIAPFQSSRVAARNIRSAPELSHLIDGTFHAGSARFGTRREVERIVCFALQQRIEGIAGVRVAGRRHSQLGHRPAVEAGGAVVRNAFEVEGHRCSGSVGDDAVHTISRVSESVVNCVCSGLANKGILELGKACEVHFTVDSRAGRLGVVRAVPRAPLRRMGGGV